MGEGGEVTTLNSGLEDLSFQFFRMHPRRKLVWPAFSPMSHVYRLHFLMVIVYKHSSGYIKGGPSELTADANAQFGRIVCSNPIKSAMLI